jgi:hypothetical protein
MPNLPAKLASAFFLSAMATAASTALPQSTARAADCQLEPGTDAAQQGKHWYYRTERSTGRKCWYVRDADDKSARAETPAPVPAEKPAPQRAEAAPTRSLSDAHAEIAPRTHVAEGAPAPGASIWQSARPAAAALPAVVPPAVVPPAANSVPLPAPAPLARWPQAAAPAPAANPQPDASLATADATDPDTTGSTDAAAETLPPPASLTNGPAERNTGSLQKLLLVAGGALALAGLTGSAVYRLGRRRKRQDWLRERSNWQALESPHEPPWIDPQFAPANSNTPDLDEVKPGPRLEIASTAEANEAAEHVEKIEDFLARLTRQLHDELEGAPTKSARAAS